jgi:protein CrcB
LKIGEKLNHLAQLDRLSPDSGENSASIDCCGLRRRRRHAVALRHRQLGQRQLAAALLSGTLAVNLVGCLLIGVLYGLLIRPEVPIEVRAGLMVGFLGGLTTFSSFSLDTVRLLESGQVPLALGYAAISVFGGLLATWAGLSLLNQTYYNERTTCSIPNCYVATFRT